MIMSKKWEVWDPGSGDGGGGGEEVIRMENKITTAMARAVELDEYDKEICMV